MEPLTAGRVYRVEAERLQAKHEPLAAFLVSRCGKHDMNLGLGSRAGATWSTCMVNGDTFPSRVNHAWSHAFPWLFDGFSVQALR